MSTSPYSTAYISFKVQAGSGSVDGLFDITIGNNTLKDVNATISQTAMNTLFDIEFKDYGGKITRYSIVCLQQGTGILSFAQKQLFLKFHYSI